MQRNVLDMYLETGYFRTQQTLFTCHLIPFDEELYSVHWLRIHLPAVTFGPKQRRLFRINESFTVTVRPFTLTDELNGLYGTYRTSVSFDAPESVASCLFDGLTQHAFDTYLLEVRDDGLLIAAGIFDNGFSSIAGIMNFYHPAYHRHSLGKYLMLLKTKLARDWKKGYYYPGYLIYGYPKFDYKLFACQSATEVYDARRGVWLPFSWETVRTLSADLMAGGE